MLVVHFLSFKGTRTYTREILYFVRRKDFLFNPFFVRGNKCVNYNLFCILTEPDVLKLFFINRNICPRLSLIVINSKHVRVRSEYII